MYGNMMQMPLLISALLRHADAYHGDTEIVSRLAPGEIHRYTYRDAHGRTRQVANALGSLVPAVSSLRQASPFYQYAAVDPLRHGLTLAHSGPIAVAAAALVAVAVVAFDRRDLA